MHWESNADYTRQENTRSAVSILQKEPVTFYWTLCGRHVNITDRSTSVEKNEINTNRTWNPIGIYKNSFL